MNLNRNLVDSAGWIKYFTVSSVIHFGQRDRSPNRLAAFLDPPAVEAQALFKMIASGGHSVLGHNAPSRVTSRTTQ